MYFVINDKLKNKTEKIHTKRGAIAKLRELYYPLDTLEVPSYYFKEYLADKSVHSSLADVTIDYIIYNCMNTPYAVSYKYFDIRCVKEYEVEGIEEQLFELNDLIEPLFHYDYDFTFNMAIKWFKTTSMAKEFEDNPLGINWEIVVKQDYNNAIFDSEYSDELVNMYIDTALEAISQMSTGDMAIFNDLKITCH